MNNTVTTKEIQNLIARETWITNELQNRSNELIASVSASAQLHFNDLAIFSNTKASKAEEELEIAREQIKDLKQELDDARQELQNAFQMLDFLSQEVNACYSTPVETEKPQFNEDSATVRLNLLNQSLARSVQLLSRHQE